MRVFALRIALLFALLNCILYLKAEYMGLLFEWDEEKERRNIKKHGIDFETASHVRLAAKLEKESYYGGKVFFFG